VDLQYTTDSFNTRDWTWIANRAGIAEQAQPLTVLIADMTEATHYPDGFIKPGIILAQYPSGGNAGLWAPYVHDDVAELLDTPGAIVLDGGRVREINGTTVGTRVTVSGILAGWPLHVFVSKLPGLLDDDGTTAHAVVAADLPAGFVNVDGI
jgi:hypothetical protein